MTVAGQSAPPRTVLEQLIREDPRSYDTLAADFNKLAYARKIDATISSKHLQRLARAERPHSTSHPGTRQVLELMFSTPFEQLFADPASFGSSAASGLVLPGDPIAGLQLLARTDLANGQDHEPQLEVVTEDWRRLAISWLVDPDPSSETADPTRPITRSDVSAIHDATAMISSYDYRYGGGRSRLMIVQALAGDALPRLPYVSNRTKIGREYLSSVASLTRLAAWSAYDTGLHGHAQKYFEIALKFAQRAGDRGLGGRILAGMSHQANYLGDYERAVELARAAHRGDRDSIDEERGRATPTMRSLFHAMEARALASLGREDDATRALIAAENEMSQSRTENDPDWIKYFDAAELHAEFAHSFRDLGKAQLAHDHAEQSIAAAGPVYVRSAAFCRTVVATSHLQRRDLDHAVSVAREVVDTARQLQSNRIITYLDDFRAQLRDFGDTPLVREFEDYTQAQLLSESLPMARRLTIA